MKVFGREIRLQPRSRAVPPEEMACFGCGRDGDRAKKLIAGRPAGVFICDRCVAEAEAALRRHEKAPVARSGLEQAEGRRCSFCDKPAPVATAGKEIGICQECVEICQEILVEDRLLESRRPGAGDPWERRPPGP